MVRTMVEFYEDVILSLRRILGLFGSKFLVETRAIILLTCIELAFLFSLFIFVGYLFKIRFNDLFLFVSLSLSLLSLIFINLKVESRISKEKIRGKITLTRSILIFLFLSFQVLSLVLALVLLKKL